MRSEMDGMMPADSSKGGNMWPFRRNRLSPVDVVSFYQSLGFFRGQNAEQVLKTYEREHGEPFTGASPWDDYYLLAGDREGVWADDPECDCCEGEYTRFLRELAAISEGAFRPERLSERWETDDGPISVHFTLSGEDRFVEPEYHDDWLDLAILDPINEMILPTGRQFGLAADGNLAVIVCVPTQTIQVMRKRRRYPFLVPPRTPL